MLFQAVGVHDLKFTLCFYAWLNCVVFAKRGALGARRTQLRKQNINTFGKSDVFVPESFNTLIRVWIFLGRDAAFYLRIVF